MINLKTIYILSLLAFVAFVHSAAVKETEPNPKSDYPFTLIAVACSTKEEKNCTIESYEPEKDSWSVFARFEQNVSDDFTPFVSNGKVFIFGGSSQINKFSDEVLAFDLATKTKSYLAPMGQKKKIVGVAEIDGFICVSGGMGIDYSAHNTVERYDPSTNSWTAMTPMLQKRYSHAVNVWEGKMYVAGGQADIYTELNSLEIYDPKLKSWKFGKPMQFNRQGFSIVFLDGSLFAFGGNPSDEFPEGERLDLVTQEWSNVINTIDSVRWKSAVVLGSNIIISGRFEETFEFNPKTNQLRELNKKVTKWTYSKSFLVPRSLISIVKPDIVPEKETLITLIALGPSYPETDTFTVEFYNPEKDSWTILSNIKLNATEGYSAIASHGKLYIFGGVINHHEYFDEVISFDLTTKEISNLTPMGQKKGRMGLVEINGYIYVSGGIGNNLTIYNIVERYDPKTDSWTVMAPMLAHRYFHAVTVWDGKMYVAGGSDDNFGKLNSLEIYDPKLNKWTLGVPMTTSRYLFSIVFLDGNLFAFGGNWMGGSAYGERLDSNAQQWTSFNSTKKSSLMNSAIAFNDKIIVSGGKYHNYEFDPKTNDMKEISPNIVYRMSPTYLLASMS
ncbi:uncharacterized protein LOC143916824 [Arctopsyche grandis]|uniref:uncharacterized protein LOC143916824 n=1 Tax=Arctopsyche grandis TaxID=121162 RepID=UPI00406D80D5